MAVSACVLLPANGKRSWPLKWQRPARQQMFHRSQQCADRMGCRSGSEILGCDVQINLCAADLPMAEQIANSHEPYALAHQVGRKRVAHAVW